MAAPSGPTSPAARRCDSSRAPTDHVEFIETGSENGKRYGQQGQGSGRMPGFGQLLTEEQIQAIVDYERECS